MKPRSIPVWLYLLAGVVLLLIVSAIFWKPIALRVMSWSTEREFADAYRAGPGSVVTIKHPGDWAFEFGGKEGLRRLERLCKSPDMTPAGRDMAVDVHRLIANNLHVLMLREEVRVGLGTVFRRQLAAYIVERDSP